MKQLEMTPALVAMIKAAVGEDVDPSGFAVFETIMLNTKPLPGKRGALFEQAIVQPITLKEMVDSINNGNHLPLVADHEMMGAPKGRLFHAALDFEDASLTMRGLFYLDQTEVTLIAKLNAGTLDEVSVAFMSREFNCSECGWDYFAPGIDRDHIYARMCANGHQIGVGGVHGEMVGLAQFLETSLVARGAADKPKIVGKSQSKLAPEGLKLLAASGFEIDELVVQASLGAKDEIMTLDPNAALLTQLTTLSASNGTLTAEKAAAERDAATRLADVTRLTTELGVATADVARLTTELATANERPDATVATERDEAVTFLHEQLDHLMVAKGETKLEGAARLTTVAALKTKIGELTANLTSILPVGGKSNGSGGSDVDAKTATLSYDPKLAFGVRR
jgi:hypothetical protein